MQCNGCIGLVTMRVRCNLGSNSRIKHGDQSYLANDANASNVKICTYPIKINYFFFSWWNSAWPNSMQSFWHSWYPLANSMQFQYSWQLYPLSRQQPLHFMAFLMGATRSTMVVKDFEVSFAFTKKFE